jgi:type II secretory pathway component GspD/PulD (secretin)
MKTHTKLFSLASLAFVALAGLAQTNLGPANVKPMTPPDLPAVLPSGTMAPAIAAAAVGPASKPVAPPDVPTTNPVVQAPLAATPTAPAAVPKPAEVAPRLAEAAAKPVVVPKAGVEVPKPTASAAKTPAEAAQPGAASDVVPLIVIDDVPLLQAVMNLARTAGLNFQIDPRVTAVTNQPNVTVRFENVTTGDALAAVLDNNGLALQYDLKTRIARITLKDAKAEEPLVTRVIQLKYSSPSNMVTLLKSMLPSTRTQILPDTRTSQIVVQATEKELLALRLEDLMMQLDAPTKQVLIEAQLWETAKNPSSVKGIDWTGTVGAQRVTFGNGNTTGQFTDSRSSSANTISPGATTITPGGRPVTDPSSTSSSANNSMSSVLNTLTGNGGLSVNTMSGLSPATAFLNADGLSAVLSFLNTDSDTELVATPRAVTLDTEMATLNVSRAYPVWQVTPGSANSPAGSQIIWTNLGVILQVTPRIAGNNNVSLHISPEVSDIAAVDQKIIGGQIFQANIYGIRRVDTHVMIKSGATLVMGGLINDRASKAYTKIPILGDLPGAGFFFRKEEKKRDKSNLLIFVTPTIIEEGDLQANKPSGFLKSELKPEQVDKPLSWFDSGAPYDWTKPKTNTLSTTAGSKTGKL